MLQRKTRNSIRKYKELRSKANNICRKKKREAMKKKIKNIEELQIRKEYKKFYKEVNTLKTGFNPKLNVIKDSAGAILSEEHKVLDRWAEYFQNLLNNDQHEVHHPVYQTAQPYVEPPTLDEVITAINQLKNGKAPGEDNLPAELFKEGGRTLWCKIHILLTHVWEQETLPEDWNVGLILPIFKKGDKLQCRNYRGITLLNVAYKILSSILNARLTAYSEENIEEYQAGFRPNRSTIDQIFSLRQAMEKCYEYNIDLHFIFVDFLQAFDKVNRNAIFNALEKIGIPHKLIRMVGLTLRNTKAKVRIGNDKSEAFDVKAGVRQGDALSAQLFNITLQAVMEKIVEKGTIINKSKQSVAYADDIALLARNMSSLKENYIKLEQSAALSGLKINETKTKYMKMSRNETRRNQQNLTIGEYNLEGVNNFEYLGSELNNKNMMSDCIHSRIQAGNRSYYANIKLFKSKIISRNSKLKLYKTLIRPVVTYGAECWSMTTTEENALNIFERKILRKIFGPIRVSEELWRRRSNTELNELIENATIVKFIKSQRLRWAGHVQRMGEHRIPKILMNGRIEGRRLQGRPRKRWIDSIEEDLKRMSIRNWKSVARNRDEWRGIVMEAKVHPGL